MPQIEKTRIDQERTTLQSDKPFRVYFLSNACEEGLLDTQRLRFLSKDAGLTSTNSARRADLILFYACGHLRKQEVESAQIIERINRLKKPSARLIVLGCLPKINPRAIQRIYDGPSVGPEEWDFFTSLFNQPRERINHIFANILYPRVNSAKFASPHQAFDFFNDELYKHTHKSARARWYIKIVSGCRNCCTYCSDHLAYKGTRSVSVDSILRQFELGLAANYKYFQFVGRDIGSYGYDMGLTLVDLLNKIAKAYPDQTYKISLYNFSPESIIDLYPKLDKNLLSKRIFEIASDIQSGSEKVLKLMGKRLKLDDWEKIIQDIDKNYPRIKVFTSIMLGFPGETEKDFKKTINLISKPLFDRIRWYTYCERPNLPSLKLRGRVPEATKMRRMKEAKKMARAAILRRRILRRIQMRARAWW